MLLLKMERMAMRLKKTWVDWRGASGQVYFEHRVAQYHEMWGKVAHALGGELKALNDGIWELTARGSKTRINNYQLEFDNPVVLAMAGDKPLMHELLSSAGLCVPEHKVFNLYALDVAYDFLEKHPKGSVIKPGNGYGGKGVTTHVLSRKEARRAAILASLYGSTLMIEAQIPGESYRLLVLGGRMVHAVCRRGPRLTGDGSSRVSELIRTENERRKNARQAILDKDRDMVFTLDYQGLDMGSIPAKGRTFPIKSVNDPERKQAEVRTVYNEDSTTLVCESIKKDAEMAAAVLGSEFVGVDVITTDPSRPLKETGGIINEVNTTPALHHHYFPGDDEYPQTALLAVEMLLNKKKDESAGASARSSSKR
ncbi:MAG: hypothetical protein HY886_02560 [Deltaproteobacteria bacterium]|nr:hypothetical protein [Deltaproteobacteria bacterium]